MSEGTCNSAFFCVFISDDFAISGQCFLCGSSSTSKCQDCKVWFCEDEHRTLHFDDQGQCYPYKVQNSPKIGRFLVATRDLEPGDLVLVERPLTVGNLHETPPICLVCWQLVDGSFHCEKCDLPMCGSQCSLDPQHADFECLTFSNEQKSPVIQSDKGQSHPFYECITPLRCLLLKQKSPQKWAAISVVNRSY